MAFRPVQCGGQCTTRPLCLRPPCSGTQVELSGKKVLKAGSACASVPQDPSAAVRTGAGGKGTYFGDSKMPSPRFADGLCRRSRRRQRHPVQAAQGNSMTVGGSAGTGQRGASGGSLARLSTGPVH